MHTHEKFIVAALFAAASASQAYAVEVVSAGTSQQAGFITQAVMPVTASASLIANTGGLAPAAATAAPVDSFTRDLDQASSNFGTLTVPAPSLDGAVDAHPAAQQNAGAGALSASDPRSFGMLLLGAGVIFLSGKRRKNDAPWESKPLKIAA